MGEIQLNASVREASKKFREPGFVPGVVYGYNVETTSVKFDEKDLRKAIVSGGANARVWVKIGRKAKKFGFIKEVQKKLLKDQIQHVDIQLVSKDQEINMSIPIQFKGVEQLRSKQLMLNIQKSDINAVGKMEYLPDSLEIDVSEMELNDAITIESFNLHNSVRVNDSSETVYGLITGLEQFSSEDLETETVDEMPEPEVIGEEE